MLLSSEVRPSIMRIAIVSNVCGCPWAVTEEVWVVFCCVVRLDLLWKAQDILLEVFSTKMWSGRNWKLRIYGTRADREHIEKLVHIFDFAARVEFSGYAKDMRDIWRDSHLMVLPSRAEGTPLATLEAMMCARPVVTTDVCWKREVLEEGVTGWIAEGATPSSIALALERCWAASSHLGANGGAGACESFGVGWLGAFQKIT
jgi:glycosyltransferase involved in cell wall biosynthesis